MMASSIGSDTLVSANRNNSRTISAAQDVVLNTSATGLCIVQETSASFWNSSQDSVSPEAEAYAQSFKLNVILFLSLIGVPANVINMAVFYKQGLRDRVNLCLFSLSLTDGLFLISSLCLNGENIHLYFSAGTTQTHWNAVLVNHNFICFMATGYISFVLSAIIACERCFCVISPLKYQTLMRTRTMAVIILSVYISQLGLHFIVAYKFRVGCFYDPQTGSTFTTLIEGEFYKAHRELINRLESFLFGACVSGGSVAAVTIATIITTVKLQQHMIWRTEKSSSSLTSREVALTKVLMGSSVFFIICASPSCLFRLAWFFLPEMSAGGSQHSLYLLTFWVVEGVCYFNYTFNFFIYYVMGSRYRETLRELFGRSLKKKKIKN